MTGSGSKSGKGKTLKRPLWALSAPAGWRERGFLLAQATQMTSANRLLERVRMKKRHFFPVTGRKELWREFQKSKEEKCKPL